MTATPRTRREFIYPAKPVVGDRVAIVSPSGRAAAHFPGPYERGLRRLERSFGLRPVEFPTTRATQASPAARAADIHAAFADPSISAVIASSGGEDQIRVLGHLDPAVLRASPKPFFGFSDNTNLLHLLWREGIVGYHGGLIMFQFGREGGMEPLTSSSLQRALFTHGEFELATPAAYCQRDPDWTQDGVTPLLEPADPWVWHGPTVVAEGHAWGGSLEVIDMQLQTSRYLASPAEYAGAVIFLETSGELPTASYVYRVLMCLGERGLLQDVAAILLGRTKAWSSERRPSRRWQREYAAQQRTAVLRAAADYAPDAVVVFNVDIGHTEPQLVMPMGGTVRVDGLSRRITVTY